MELVELIRGAQEAMDRGDYAFAAAACSHALATYPACFTAHRMLAEAYLEQGRADEAIEHFERTLTIDPLNVLARLGLGVAAEEKREMSTAYSAYLHAWEINPALDQVRDELVRLRGLLGSDDRLHPTRAGLAGIYARGGQFGRAAAEWRAVLMVEPTNRQARTSLAEILWRSGDDAPAAAMSREALTELPENARALGMLAEIEQRRGGAASNELIQRYQAVDPLGEIAALLSEWRDGADLGFLRAEGAMAPDFDPAAAVASIAPPPVVAPAPSVSAGPSSGLASGHFAAPDLWDTLVKDFSIEPGGGLGAAPPAEVQPFSWLDEGASAPAAVEPFSLEALMNPGHGGADDMPMSFMQSKKGPATDQLALENEIAAFVAPSPAPVVAPTASPAPAPAPVAPPKAVEPPRAPAPVRDPFVTADGRVDLTVGWDDLDRQLKEATPNFDNAAEMDALAASFGVAGLVPFEMGESPFDEAAWAPFTADDLSESSPSVPAAQAAAPVSAPPVELPAAPPPPAREHLVEPVPPAFVEDDAFDLGWDLDEELVSAIPQPQASGYTEMLRHVDIEVPQEIALDGEVDPFANPDLSGTPLAFEELLAVTSRDGTSPLGAGQVMDDGPHEAMVGELASMDELAAVFGVASNAPEAIGVEPQGLEALLWDDAPAETPLESFWAADAGADERQSDEAIAFDWAAPVETAQPVVGEGDGAGFDASLAGLGDLQPFSLDDAAGFGASESAGEVDFSDIDESPYYAGAGARGAASDARHSYSTPKSDRWTDDLIAETPEQPLADDAPDPTWMDAAIGESVEFAAEHEFEAPAAMAPVRDVSGFGVPPSGVAWPAFVNHTSELIDRSLNGGNLFARLREAKRTAASAGLLVVDRSVRDLRPVAAPVVAEEKVQVLSVAAKPGSTPLNGAARTSTMTEAERIDLMAMRVRLIEDASSAGEVAQRLEGAVQHGLTDPLALRVLGEAYLKLGRTEQAAAQFRQAMLTRHRLR